MFNPSSKLRKELDPVVHDSLCGTTLDLHYNTRVLAGDQCASVGHIEDPPSPSKTVVPRVASGGILCTWASGEEGMTGNRDDVGGGKQKLTLSPHSWKDIMPTRTSITAPTVARNGLPKITGA